MKILLTVIFVILEHSEYTDGSTSAKKRGNVISESEKLRELEERLFEHILDTYPEFATTTGERDIDGRVESFALQEFDRRQEINKGLLRETTAIDMKKLYKSELIDLKILKEHLQVFVDGYRWRYWGNMNPINFMEGPLKHLEWIRKAMKTNEESTLSRIMAIPVQFQQQTDLMKVAIEKERTNHIVSMNQSLDKVYEDARYLIGLEHYFYFINNVTQNDDFNGTDNDILIRVLNDIGKPFTELHDFLEKVYIPASRTNESLCSIPEGIDYYQACLKFHLGLQLTPRQIHDIGLREVKRIEKMMKKIVRRLDFAHGDLTQFFKYLRSLRFLYNITGKEMVGRYYKAMNKSNKKLWSLFKEIPLKKVRIIPLNNPKLAFLGAYANNKFFLNVYNSENTSTIGIMPLTFHEANPGHHFQDSYARVQPLPRYRRHILYARRYAVPTTYPTYMAYTEGWALYAEHLGMEMGLYKTPLDLFGKYSSEMFRALRLVTDTGIHAFGWTKERAIDYLAKYTDTPYHQLSAEVNRYITWPGHSCSYKIGEMKIKQLRKMAESKLGNTFDVKEFHHQVLKNGPVSLTVLENIVQDWIETSLLLSNTTRLAESKAAVTNTDISPGKAHYVVPNLLLVIVVAVLNLC